MTEVGRWLIGTFWIALLASSFASPFIYRFLLHLKHGKGVSAYAPENHQSKQGTPTMGGLILLAGFLLAVGPGQTWLSLVGIEGPALSPSMQWAALVLFGGFGLIGLVDDGLVPRMFPGKRGLGWKQKLVLQLGVATAGAWLYLGALSLGPAALFVFAVLYFANAYNFTDGLDGLAATVLIAMSAGLAVIAASVPAVPVLLAAMFGAIVPFMFLNAPPARVFMGDVGSLPVGAVLGLCYFAVGEQALATGSWTLGIAVAIVSLLMAAELIPPPLQILAVKTIKRRIFPYTPIHHAFEKAGWPETRVVWLFALVQLMLSALAIAVFAFGGAG